MNLNPIQTHILSCKKKEWDILEDYYSNLKLDFSIWTLQDKSQSFLSMNHASTIDIDLLETPRNMSVTLWSHKQLEEMVDQFVEEWFLSKTNPSKCNLQVRTASLFLNGESDGYNEVYIQNLTFY